MREKHSDFSCKIITFIFMAFMLTAFQSAETRCDKIFNKLQKQYIRKSLASSDGLHVVGTGGGIDGKIITEIGLFFETLDVLHIPEARKAIVNQVLLLQEIINSNPEYLECFPDPECLEKNFDITIFGTTPRCTEGDYIDVVTTYRGKVRYHKSDPAKKVYPYLSTYEESYQEALSIVQGHKPSSGP